MDSPAYNAPMKRFRTILLFLLLGAVVNVGVAWGLVHEPKSHEVIILTPTEILPLMTAQSLVDWYKHSHIYGTRRISRGREQIILNDSMVNRLDSFTDENQREFYETEMILLLMKKPFLRQTRSGWPFLSMYSWTSDTNPANERVTLGIEIGSWIVPYGILLRGFSMNTIILATFMWAIWYGVSQARRSLRVCMGLCPYCAYDLRGTEHEACPECGTALVQATPS